MARIGPGDFGDDGSDDDGGDSISDIVDDAADAARDAADEIGDRVSDAAGGDDTDSSSGSSSSGSSSDDDTSTDPIRDNQRPGAGQARSELEEVARNVEQSPPDVEPTSGGDSGGGTTRTFEGVDSGTDRQQASPSDGPPVYGRTGEQPEQRQTRPTGREVTDPSVNNPDFGEGTGLDDIGGGAVDAAGDVVDSGQDFARTAAEEVTPHAGLTLGQEGLRARRAREQRYAELAERGVEDITSGNLPSVQEAGGLLFQGGEIAERGIVEGGRALGQGVDYGVGVAQFGAETVAQGDIGEATSRLEAAGKNIREGDTQEGVEELSGGSGPEVGGEDLTEVPGNTVEGLVSGVGMGVGAVGQLPVTATSDITGSTPEGFEDTPSGTTGAFGQVQELGQSQIEMAQERPVSTSLLLAAPLVEGVPAARRGYRSTKGTTGTISFESATSARGARGKLPQTRTDPNAPTSKAVREVRTRAKEQPSKVQELTGSEQVLWHSTENRFSREFTAAEGSSELPGLFTSPDASPLRLSEVRSASESPGLIERLKPSRPDLSTQPDRLAAFEGSRIEGMPEWASGSGRIREGGGYKPDPTTSGAKFLKEQAEPGTAQVRPTGSRTTELEAIFPPGSEFRQTGRLAVELPGGEKVPADIFRTARGSRSGTSTTGTSGSQIKSTSSTLSDISPGTTGLSSVGYGTGFGSLPGQTTAPTTDGTTSTGSETTGSRQTGTEAFDISGAIGGTGTTGGTGGTGSGADLVDPSRPTDPTGDSGGGTSGGGSGTDTTPDTFDPSRPTDPTRGGEGTPQRTPTEPPSGPPSEPPFVPRSPPSSPPFVPRSPPRPRPRDSGALRDDERRQPEAVESEPATEPPVYETNWFAELVAAGSGTPRGAPAQGTALEVTTAIGRDVADVPVDVQVSGSEEQQERFANYAGLFTNTAAESDSDGAGGLFGFSTSENASDGWF